MNPTPASLSVEARFAETDELLEKIAERFKEGKPATDLLELLQSVWDNVPAGTTLTPEEQARLAAVMQKLNETVAIGEKSMSQAAEVLAHLARGRRMLKAYPS
ncbi:hypothetical protein [Zavarzinella formosa]|uniref:hypothetical protein n=1 Tax=Zavarzinella formosa TaxID=360055 RepID=UPI000312B1B5|nr:hypothetical protein [Zavarzinella formosa]